jgi:hypothetical protein
MQGFFTLSAEPTEDLGLEDADNDGSDDENPLAPATGGHQTSSSSSDEENINASDKEMEELGEQSSDSERGEDEDVYLTAIVHKSGTITIHSANLNAFAKNLKLKKLPVS